MNEIIDRLLEWLKDKPSIMDKVSNYRQPTTELSLENDARRKYYSFKSLLIGVKLLAIDPTSSDRFYFCCKESSVFLENSLVPGYVRLWDGIDDGNVPVSRHECTLETLAKWDKLYTILQEANQNGQIDWGVSPSGNHIWSDKKYLEFINGKRSQELGYQFI
jgi:hypothetical protein